MVFTASRVGDRKRNMAAGVDGVSGLRECVLRIEVGGIDACGLVDDDIASVLSHPVPTVRGRRAKVDDQRWIHLEWHAAALFWLNGDEEVAVPVLDPVAQQVTDLKRGYGGPRPWWSRPRPFGVVRAAG